jgi:hypothetical protein
MDDFVAKVRSYVFSIELRGQPISPDYDSIDGLVSQIRQVESAGHPLQPQACFEIGILLQETRNLMQSIYRSADYCKI